MEPFLLHIWILFSHCEAMILAPSGTSLNFIFHASLFISFEVYLLTYSCYQPENDLVVFGGGHAATLTIRAVKRGAVKPKAIAAVAPTWAGPLPIVFGRDSNMETRYYN